MRVTRRKLRQLIKEAFSGYASERPNNPMERAYARRAEEEAAAKAEEDIDHSELEETLDDTLLFLLRVPGVHDDAVIGDPPHLSDEQQALEELQAHGLTADRAKEYIKNFLKWAEEEGDEIDLSKLSRSGMYLDYSGSPGVYNESTMQIDRNHLRRIIKEEIGRITESPCDPRDDDCDGVVDWSEAGNISSSAPKTMSRHERMSAGIKVKMDDTLDRSYRAGYWDGIIGNRRSYIWKSQDRLPTDFEEIEYERGYSEGNTLHPNSNTVEDERERKAAEDESRAQYKASREEANRLARNRRDPERFPNDPLHLLSHEEMTDMTESWESEGVGERFKRVHSASRADSMYGRTGSNVGTRVLDTLLNAWVPGTQTSGHGGSLGT